MNILRIYVPNTKGRIIFAVLVGLVLLFNFWILFSPYYLGTVFNHVIVIFYPNYFRPQFKIPNGTERRMNIIIRGVNNSKKEIGPAIGPFPFMNEDICYALVFKSNLFPKSTTTFANISKIYIIHWTGNPTREPLMKKRLSKILPEGWEKTNLVSFVKPFDAENITETIVDCMGRWVYVKLGSLSVSMKHQLAYYDSYYHGYQEVLIVEDDVDFHEKFEEKLWKVNEELAKIRPGGWSNCFLSGCMKEYCSWFGWGPAICINPAGASNCAYGYLMSSFGVKQHLRDLPFAGHDQVSNPDWVMNYLARKLIERHHEPYISYLSNLISLLDDLDIIWESPEGTDGTWREENYTLKIQPMRHWNKMNIRSLIDPQTDYEYKQTSGRDGEH